MNIRCPHCLGKGEVHLKTISKPLRDCYAVMKRIGPATREAIHDASKVKGHVTQTYKRIMRLERMGLVEKIGEERPAKFQVG